MSEAKIRLSSKEMEIATSTELILTKNAVLQKVNQLLVALQEEQQIYLTGNLPALPGELLGSSPRISRGENYRGLPWYMLDYPRFFEQENIFALRTMFWWGHFFSVTLHLSGKYKIAAEEKIRAGLSSLKEQGFFICTGEAQWEHHFEAGNYRPMNEMSDQQCKEALEKSSFIKLANKISLTQWNDAPAGLLLFFKQLLQIVG